MTMISKDLVRVYKKEANYHQRKNGANSQVAGLLEAVQERAASHALDLLSKPNDAQMVGLIFPERKFHPKALIAAVAGPRILKVVLPACAPPVKDRRSFQPAISPEARAGIRAARLLTSEFAERIGKTVTAQILIADTETDLEPIMERAGGVETYEQACNETAGMIQEQVNPNTTFVTTFSNYFGLGEYHGLQYSAEDAIRTAMETDAKLKDKIQRTSQERRDKHESILGRPEEDYQLSIRYAAQYTALGDFVRTNPDIDAVCNYPTPNNEFYNQQDKAVVPLFESRIERKAL